MFVPRRYAEQDLAALDWLAAHDAFATMVTVADGVPFATHLPLLYQRDGEQVVFEGHVARGNPQWRQLAGQEAMLILHGPHAYVSPSWYPDPAHSVPTWNYAVAHIYGRAEVFDAPERMSAVVAELSAKYEAGVGSAWRWPQSAPDTVHELRGIVGFRLVATRVEVKYKMGQHHPAAKVESAAAALARQPDADSQAVAALMRERLARRVEPAT